MWGTPKEEVVKYCADPLYQNMLDQEGHALLGQYF